MEDLLTQTSEVSTVGEHLMKIYRNMPELELAKEHERLQQAYVDIGTKILAISEIRGAA